MADKGFRDIVLAVKSTFEGKQGQHHVHGPGDFFNPALAPGPHRGTDIVGSQQTLAAQPEFKAEVKIRRVDTQYEIGIGGNKMPE